VKRQSLEARIAAALPHDPPARAAQIAKAVITFTSDRRATLRAVAELLEADAAAFPISPYDEELVVGELRDALNHADNMLGLMDATDDAADDLRTIIRKTSAALDRWMRRHVPEPRRRRGRPQLTATAEAVALESMLRKQLGLSARKCADVLAALNLNAATAEKYRRRANKKNVRRTK
jgi:hypothetical protein